MKKVGIMWTPFWALLLSVANLLSSTVAPLPLSNLIGSNLHTPANIEAAETGTSGQSEEPWMVERVEIPVGSGGNLIGHHTVIVIPMEPPLPRKQFTQECKMSIAKIFDISDWAPECPWRGTSREVRRKSLAAVAEAWRRKVPGLSVEFVVHKPIKVPKLFCSDSEAALSRAREIVPEFAPDTPFAHLAAIVDCGGGAGVATIAPGYGFIWMKGWMPRLIAHEFGHNLNLLHSNSISCPARTPPAPDFCQQVVYGDHDDFMGAPQIDALAGIERALSTKGLGLFGAHRAVLLGAKRLQLEGEPVAARLQSQDSGAMAKPVMVNTDVGPVFLDMNTRGGHIKYRGNICPANGVTARVATSSGLTDFVSNQAQLVLGTRMSGQAKVVDMLDSFRLPGTDYRVLVTGRDRTSLDLRLIPDVVADPAPMLSRPDISILRRSSTFVIRLPRPTGILGYSLDGFKCPIRALAGTTVKVKAMPKLITVRSVDHQGEVSRPLMIRDTGVNH